MDCEHAKSAMLNWIKFLLSMYVRRNKHRKLIDFGVNRRPFSSIFPGNVEIISWPFPDKRVISTMARKRPLVTLPATL